MATISLEPIPSNSRAGYPVLIRGVRPATHDCIIGEISTPGMGLVQAEWNLSGIMRGGTDETNLDMHRDELDELVRLAKSLGAQS